MLRLKLLRGSMTKARPFIRGWGSTRSHRYICMRGELPSAGVVMVALPIFLLGLLMRYDWGAVTAGILWIFVLIGGLIITWLLLGLGVMGLSGRQMRKRRLSATA